ncbi:MAG TPA: SDR family NAD(P)-dependent oxidoreductase, partial [Longimicrobiales bacterium]|nr:SDR family NAD(P)-dependent oxidoreductase [Longimicrobiales bacterium]
MAELSGQIALVTGGSRGIGRSICERLARDGARVAVVARDAERAQATARALDGEGHKGYACDVADSAAVDGLVKQVEQDMGGLDILVNNAGVTADNLLVRIDDAS